MSSFFISMVYSNLKFISLGTGLTTLAVNNYLSNTNNSNNNENIENDYVVIKNIPTAPIFPKKFLIVKPYNLNIKVKTRFLNFECYKKYLKNKRKNKRKKQNNKKRKHIYYNVN
jgi:hypothetical protein